MGGYPGYNCVSLSGHPTVSGYIMETWTPTNNERMPASSGTHKHLMPSWDAHGRQKELLYWVWRCLTAALAVEVAFRRVIGESLAVSNTVPC